MLGGKTMFSFSTSIHGQFCSLYCVLFRTNWHIFVVVAVAVAVATAATAAAFVIVSIALDNWRLATHVAHLHIAHTRNIQNMEIVTGRQLWIMQSWTQKSYKHSDEHTPNTLQRKTILGYMHKIILNLIDEEARNDSRIHFLKFNLSSVSWIEVCLFFSLLLLLLFFAFQ